MLGNDTDPDGDTLTVSGKTNGTHGTVTCTSTACTYTPTGGYTGDDSYTYTVADGKGGTATGTVSVTVTNRAPNAVDDTATVGTGGTVGISVLGNDTDPDGHTLSVTTPAPTAAKGTVTCSSTSCSYTAHLGESGTDTFTYAVSDGHGGTDTATVTVTITTPVQPATISIAVNDTTLVWPQVVTVTGVAKKLNGTVMPGVSLQLWARPAGGDFSPVGSAHTTTSQGLVSQTHRPATGTTYQWRHVGGSVTSAGKAVTVAPALRASVSRTRLAAGAPLVISGTSSPTRAGAPVVLQQLVAGHWQNLHTSNFATDTASTTGGAAYSFTVTQTASRKYSYRVQVPADSGRVTRTSATISVSVYKAKITGVKAAGDEYVTIKNTGTVAINLSGWKLKDASATTVTLPSRTLAAGASVRVHTRRGTNNAGNIYLNKPLMWNTHDTARLFDNRAWQMSTLTY